MARKVSAKRIKELREQVDIRRQNQLIALGGSPSVDDFIRITALFWSQVGAGAASNGKRVTEDCVRFAADRYTRNVWNNLEILMSDPISLGMAMQCCLEAGKIAAQTNGTDPVLLDLAAFKTACKAQEQVQGQQGLICG